MSDVVIRAEGLGKKYLIGHETERERYVALRDVVGRTAKGLLRSADDLIRGRQLVAGDEVEEIWALKDVSFEIRRGEVVGIIGRNGAGKSTLLKILSRITEPSAGRVEIRGRVASLLEVGTGFHPELTGRENIYLNGAILGMTRAEIRRKFDEIVDFAGVEKFLDTPVKRYSSGMYVRLAFAVAAHLEPEILVVDEVLAVGDAEFQKKCLGKMGEVARGGRTVLFVSHNQGAIRKLCPRSILLAAGVMQIDAATPIALEHYLEHSKNTSGAPFLDLTTYSNRYGSGEIKVTSARLLNHEGLPSLTLTRLRPATLEFTLSPNPNLTVNLSIVCLTTDGAKLLQLDHHDAEGFRPGRWNGSQNIRVHIPALPLQCGDYSWAIGVHTTTLSPIDVVLEALRFSVEDDVRSPRPYRSIAKNGYCTLLANWSTFLDNSRERRPTIAANSNHSNQRL